MFKITAISCMFLLAGNVAVANEPYAYVGQQDRVIKALSPQEVEDYLEGRGMGFARAAELNRFPGPMHVLELADKLQLTADQKARTQEIRAAMQRDAKALGKALVDKERELDRAFASAAIDAETLRRLTAEIGRLQADTRRVHLQAHLEQRAILTPTQIAAYDTLRGYTGNVALPRSHGSHGH